MILVLDTRRGGSRSRLRYYFLLGRFGSHLSDILEEVGTEEGTKPIDSENVMITPEAIYFLEAWHGIACLTMGPDPTYIAASHGSSGETYISDVVGQTQRNILQ